MGGRTSGDKDGIRNDREIEGNDERGGGIQQENDRANGERNEDISKPLSKVNNNKMKKWRIMLQNIHGIVGENTRWKINHIKEIVENQRILIMNFTEKWLNDTVKDYVEIEGYKMIRKDKTA